MSLMSAYLNQTAKWEKFISEDGTATPQFEAPKNVAARCVHKRTFYQDSQGDLVLSTSVVYTEAPVQAGDKINDTFVKAVESMVDLSGATRGYKVIL